MAKEVNKKPAKKAAAVSRRVRLLTKKQAKEKAKKEAYKESPIPNSFQLMAKVFRDFRKFWKPLSGILLVYLVLNIIFTTGFISNINSSVSTIRSDLNSTHSLSKAVSGFGSLLGSGGQSSSVAQSLLLVLESLVIIWALRHLLAGENITVKQAYYRSTTPLIPFMLVIFVIILQLLPITIGAATLAVVLSSAFTATGLLTVVFAILLALLALWSFYMISSSIFALYIVTLPDMQPRQALRSARNLVRFRRWSIMRRLLFLPICILLLMGLVVVPLILLTPFLITAVYFVLTMLAILFANTYLYNLYRGLIE